MSPVGGFTLAFSITLALLAGAVAAGLLRRRKLHISLVVLTLAGLGATIWQACGVGELYDLQAAGAITDVHLALARVTTLALILPAATGLRLLFVPSGRRLHRVMAFVVVGLMVCSAITGVAMFLQAEPLPVR